MLSNTFKEYKENYPIKLKAFLVKYEDNTEKLFLEKEYVKYTKSHRAMVEISNYLKKFPIDERSDAEVWFNTGNNLKIVNERAYQDIVTSKRDYPNGGAPDLFEPIAVKVNYKKLENWITSSTLILKFITGRLIPLIQDSESSKDDEIISSNSDAESDFNNVETLEVNGSYPYPHVFSSLKAFQLFERLCDQYKSSNTLLADFSFIYWKMHDDGYILDYFKPKMFRDWIIKDPYYIDVKSKLKTLDNCSTDQKNYVYSTSKKLIQIK